MVRHVTSQSMTRESPVWLIYYVVWPTGHNVVVEQCEEMLLFEAFAVTAFPLTVPPATTSVTCSSSSSRSDVIANNPTI